MNRTRSTVLAVATVLATLGCAGTAGAHIQVNPTTVAPDDPVQFTVLIPSERPAHTTTVDLRLPPGVLPFSYGETPGWTRRLVTTTNGAVERIVWTGKLAEDGFAAFSFLAGTPEKPTTLTWKALQTYDDGSVARWIGAPESENPAPVTKVLADARRQNAGGEGGESEVKTDATVASSGGPAAAAADDTDWFARGLGVAALLVALVGVALVLRRLAGPADHEPLP